MNMIAALAEKAFRLGKPSQILEEYVWMATRIVDLLGNPISIVELGSQSGGTLMLWSAISAPGARIVAVDLPYAATGMQYKPAGPTDDTFLRACVAPDKKFTLVRKSTYTYAALDEAGVEPHSVDVLFIDADHREAGVRADFWLWSHVVRDGGVIVFHDVHPGGEEIQVYKLWAEISARCPSHVESYIHAPATQYGAGVGIIKINEESRAALRIR